MKASSPPVSAASPAAGGTFVTAVEFVALALPAGVAFCGA
eukprot:CAMPEP_0183781318 /NCGR_PEP_ID=MMETSP0739-20130205/58403_1 /TAXON_ID=385413 /ORGANISM="Thalassiosira miniscula, Strain CCMP1093" /LENGTH=39 /DNA_ID= /DNA_START= /DNA_END= /DNA_ORIENTATION=